MDNKKKFSKDYRDYKYVYTGYEDYLKQHKLKKEDIESNADEIIDHDHNYQFDFNNPNEHTHDYSFEFDNNKQYKPREKTEYEQKREYTVKSNNNFTPPPQEPKPTSNNVTYRYTFTPDQKDPAKTFVKSFLIIFFIIFLIPFIIGFFSGLTEESDYESNYDGGNEEIVDSDDNDNYGTTINNVKRTFCNAVYNKNLSILKKYITPEEYSKYTYRLWALHLSPFTTSQDRYVCYDEEYQVLNEEERDNLQYQYEYLFDGDATIDEAYQINIKLKKYEASESSSDSPIFINVAKIEDKYYLINMGFYYPNEQ